VYDTDGNHLRTDTPIVDYSDWIILENDTIIYDCFGYKIDPQEGINTDANLIVTHKNKIIGSAINSRLKPKGLTLLRDDDEFSQTHSSLFYHESLFDTVYEIKSIKDIHPVYTINFNTGESSGPPSKY
jgi:hypothetical protein